MAAVLLNGAPSLLCRFVRRAEYSPDGFIKDVFEALLRQGGTLEVLDGSDFLGHAKTLRIRDWSELAVPQFVQCVFVVP